MQFGPMRSVLTETCSEKNEKNVCYSYLFRCATERFWVGRKSTSRRCVRQRQTGTISSTCTTRQLGSHLTEIPLLLTIYSMQGGWYQVWLLSGQLSPIWTLLSFGKCHFRSFLQFELNFVFSGRWNICTSS